MKRVVLIVLVFGLIPAMKGSSKPEDYAQVAYEGKGCSAPKQWGQLKGVADRAVAFEDSSGTIRVLDLGPCMRGETQLIVKINRQ
jgi:hypothetical protein